MGLNASYLSSKLPMSKLAEIYRINLGTANTEIPDDRSSWIAELSNGWTIWWQEGTDAFRLNAINPHLACAQGEACYAVSVSEFSMHSGIAKYTATSKRWSVAHHGDGDDPQHLNVTGKPPEIFEELRDELFAAQRAQTISPLMEQSIPDELKSIVDIIGGTIAPMSINQVDHVFDLPIRMGEHFFGFRYDRQLKPGTVILCRKILPYGSEDPDRKIGQKPKSSLW